MKYESSTTYQSKVLANGKVANRQADRQTDRQTDITKHYVTLQAHKNKFIEDAKGKRNLSGQTVNHCETQSCLKCVQCWYSDGNHKILWFDTHLREELSVSSILLIA